MTKENLKASWEPAASVASGKPAGLPLVKSIGCTACWAAKSISLTRSCLPVTPINLAI